LVTLIKIITWFYAAVPRAAALWWGRMLGRFLWLILPGKRKQAHGALAASFPEWPTYKVRQTVKAVFINQGVFLAETLRYIGKPRENPFDSIKVDPAYFAEAARLHQQGKGLLVLTGHVNNYELLASWAAQHYPLTIIVKDIKPESLNDFINKRRTESGVNVLPARKSYRAALRVLKEGKCIGFIFDQNMKHRDGVFVTFFGRPACTTAGLAMLSAMTGAPVLPAFLLREGTGFRVRMLPAIPPPANRDIATLQDTTQLYSNAMEQVIREQPESWIWMHKRWKTQPEPGDRITLPDGSDRYV